MTQNNTPQPVRIVREGSTITSDNDVREKLVAASEAFADLLRSTYGPKGLDKMLYKSNGETAVTNDGAKIVAELLVKHPAAKAFVNLGEAQENAIGDGVTGCLLFAGALMHEAGLLFRKGVHPLIIVEGFLRGMEIVIEMVENSKIKIVDLGEIKNVAKTAMTGKISDNYTDFLSELVVDSIHKISREEEGVLICDSENVIMDKSNSESFSDSYIVEGVVIRQRVGLDKLRVNYENVNIITLSCPLTMQKTVRDMEIEIETPQQMTAFIENERSVLDKIVESILNLKVKCVFSDGEIDDAIMHSLAENDIFVMGNLDNKMIENISFAVGSTVCGKLSELSETDIGFAGALDVVSSSKDGGVEDKIFIDKCVNPKVVTIVVGGTNDLGVEEIIRALHDALKVVALVVKSGEVVRGGGNMYQLGAQSVRESAEKIGGRERLAMEGYARALETIPGTLSANSGKRSLDNVLKLRSMVLENKNMGILSSGDVGEITNVWEPVEGMLHAIKGATETAVGLLRVDQMISARGD